MTTPTFYNRTAAAHYLTRRLGRRISVHNLEDRACKGTGPTYAIVSRQARYQEADLDAWAARERQGSGERR